MALQVVILTDSFLSLRLIPNIYPVIDVRL